MASGDTDASLFPVLNDGIYGEVTFTECEIPHELLQAATVYALEEELELRWFLLTVWSVVMRQYTESDTVCFGVYGTTKQKDHGACQVILSPETPVQALWSREGEKVSFLDGGHCPPHNTAVWIADNELQDPPALFEELERAPEGSSVRLMREEDTEKADMLTTSLELRSAAGRHPPTPRADGQNLNTVRTPGDQCCINHHTNYQ